MLRILPDPAFVVVARLVWLNSLLCSFILACIEAKWARKWTRNVPFVLTLIGNFQKLFLHFTEMSQNILLSSNNVLTFSISFGVVNQLSQLSAEISGSSLLSVLWQIKEEG